LRRRPARSGRDGRPRGRRTRLGARTGSGRAGVTGREGAGRCGRGWSRGGPGRGRAGKCRPGSSGVRVPRVRVLRVRVQRTSRAEHHTVGRRLNRPQRCRHIVNRAWFPPFGRPGEPDSPLAIGRAISDRNVRWPEYPDENGCAAVRDVARGRAHVSETGARVMLQRPSRACRNAMPTWRVAARVASSKEVHREARPAEPA
jgi:hypothetical protein